MSLMEFVCSACGTKHYLQRALAVECPTCSAPVGKRCRDLRSKDPAKTRVQPHPEREAQLP